jgi:DNA polymerase-3 subunit delta
MLVLVKSKNDFLQNRAVKEALFHIKKTRKANGETDEPEVIYKASKTYLKGDINAITTPSLFGGSSILVLEKAEELTDDLITDVKTICDGISKSVKTDFDVIIVHSGAVRGKAMITAIEKAHQSSPKEANVISAEEPKKQGEKVAFVQAECRRYSKTIANDAADMLVQYEGNDIGVLCGYIRQLCSDVAAPDGSEMSSITAGFVAQFFKGIRQIDIWDIINAAFGRNSYKAIALYRHAVASEGVGITFPLISNINTKLTQLVKVSAMRSRNLSPKDLGMAPWQVDNVRKDMKNFTTEKLKNSFAALSTADYSLKGGAPDGGALAFENALRVISA